MADTKDELYRGDGDLHDEGLSPLKAQDKAYAVYVKYPRVNRLRDDVMDCHALSTSTGRPHCMSLEGPTGTGKTSMLETYADSYSPGEQPDGTAHIQVLYVLVDSPVTVYTLSEQLLDALGDPAATKGNQKAKNDRIVYYLKLVKCELVILDDFHNLTLIETDYKLALVSHWLKAIIKRSKVSFLVVGITEKVEPILNSNPELSRFFSVRETLYPFNYDPKDGPNQEFDRFIGQVEKAIGMELDSAWPRADMLFRLQYGTLGVVSNVMSLLRPAQARALKQGKSMMEMADLCFAFEKHVQKHVHTKYNPFEVNDKGKAATGISRLASSQLEEAEARSATPHNGRYRASRGKRRKGEE
jgi:Bacterial TniB protein